MQRWRAAIGSCKEGMHWARGIVQTAGGSGSQLGGGQGGSTDCNNVGNARGRPEWRTTAESARQARAEGMQPAAASSGGQQRRGEEQTRQ